MFDHILVLLSGMNTVLFTCYGDHMQQREDGSWTGEFYPMVSHEAVWRGGRKLYRLNFSNRQLSVRCFSGDGVPQPVEDYVRYLSTTETCPGQYCHLAIVP